MLGSLHFLQNMHFYIPLITYKIIIKPTKIPDLTYFHNVRIPEIAILGVTSRNEKYCTAKGRENSKRAL